MLHLETVEPGTFSILRRLLSLNGMKHFHLVGGTALSLLYGHRISVDLDLFSSEPFDSAELVVELRETFGIDFSMENIPRATGIFCYIKGVKVDIVRYPFRMIREQLLLDGIRMYAPEDIMAMKAQAIFGRAKKKDFWDIAELLQHYSVADFIQCHQEKYPTQQLLISVPQAMVYFDEVKDDEDPVSLKGQTWMSVKMFISRKVEAFLQ
jgi:hypothetical protein